MKDVHIGVADMSPFSDSERIFHEYRPLIVSILGRSSYARYGIDYDDLVQEARIRLWKAFRHPVESPKIAGYVRKVVNSVVIDYLKAARKEHRLARWPADVPAGIRSARVVQTIYDCLSVVSDRKRPVVAMYLRGYDVPDIARIMKWSPSKTYSMYTRGMNELRVELRKRGIGNGHIDER